MQSLVTIWQSTSCVRNCTHTDVWLICACSICTVNSTDHYHSPLRITPRSSLFGIHTLYFIFAVLDWSRCHFKPCPDNRMPGAINDGYAEMVRRRHHWTFHPVYCGWTQDCYKEGREGKLNFTLGTLFVHFHRVHGWACPRDLNTLKEIWELLLDKKEADKQIGSLQHRALDKDTRSIILQKMLWEISLSFGLGASKSKVTQREFNAEFVCSSSSDSADGNSIPSALGLQQRPRAGDPVTGLLIPPKVAQTPNTQGKEPLRVIQQESGPVHPGSLDGSQMTPMAKSWAQGIHRAVQYMLEHMMRDQAFLKSLSEARQGLERIDRRIPNLERELSEFTYTKTAPHLHTLVGRIMSLPVVGTALSANKKTSSNSSLPHDEVKQRLLHETVELSKIAARQLPTTSIENLMPHVGVLLRNLTSDLGLHAQQPSTRQAQPQSANRHSIPLKIRSGRDGVTRPSYSHAAYGQTYLK